MDWIRRNWPDLLIGIALLLVIAGIIATLLSGGSFLPFARNNTNPVAAPTIPTPTTQTNTATNSNAITEPTTSATDTSATTVVEPNTSTTITTTTNTTVNTNAATEATATETGSNENVIAPVIPDLPTVGTDTTSTTTTTETATESTQSTDTSTSTETSSTASSTSTNITASNSTSAPYRVGVGAFGNTENAERHASTFRNAGYPVFIGEQGNLSLVLVGPYNSRAEAEAIQTELRSSGLQPDATVYEFTYEFSNNTADATAPSSSSSSDSTAATTSSSTTTPTTTEQTTATATTTGFTPPPTAQSGRYLQVGAYNNIETSMPQRQKLEALGYTVQYIEENNFIKLLVGPYNSSNLSIAESQLTAQGIDSFVR